MFRLFIIMSFFALSACSTEGERRQEEYLNADYLTRLELPPDLIFENNELNQTQLTLPKPTDKASKQFASGLDETKFDRAEANAKIRLSEQVLPVFEGLRLRSEEGLNWLEIDKSAEVLWPVLIAFWENEGVALSKAEPMLGFIQTDWVAQYQLNENDGFFSKLVTLVDKDRSDRFRMRLTAGETPSQTKIFVTHSGLEKIVEENGSHLVSRPSEIELEVEVLNRLLVFMGLSKQDASGLLVGYRPFTRRSKLSSADKATVVMNGSMDFVWLHTLRALDRLGLDVAEKNITDRELKVIVQKLSPENIGGEKDEIAESSFIMQWLQGAGKDAAEDVNKQFILKLKSTPKAVKIQVLNLGREPADSVLAEQMIKGLLIELH